MRKFIKEICPILLVALLFCGENAMADTDSLIVSLGLKGEYNDNIFFDTVEEKDDFITTISPGITLQKKDERTSASLKGLFDFVMYSDYSDLNNVDQLYSADIDHKLTSRFSLSGKAAYKRDSRPDRDVEETGLVLGTDVRKNQQYKAGFGYILSEKASVHAGYAHMRDDFDDPNETDFDSHTVNAQLRYDLNSWMPLTTGRISSVYSRYNYPTSKVDNYSLTFGGEKQVTEIYSIYADLGGRYNKPNNRDDSYGSVVRCGVKYNGELSAGTASLSHDIGVASGDAGLRERTSFVLSARRRITERFIGSLNGGYYLNKSDKGELSATDTDQRTIRISPRLNYRIAEHISLETAYTYTRILNKEVSGDDTKSRNLVFVRFVIDKPFFN